MTSTPDYSVLDRPEITCFVFYPRRDWNSPPHGARDCLVPVSEGVMLSSRFYPVENSKACILYFHGNGEVACEYDSFAPEYQAIGASLFVADYRGYGKSTGSPAMRTMIEDAARVYEFFHSTMGTSYGRPFVMGRSLGALSALEIAASQPDGLAGLVVESGSFSLARVLQHLGFPIHPASVAALDGGMRAMVGHITLPALVIHGEADTLIPVSEGRSLFDTLGSDAKRLVVIPRAGHNDLMFMGRSQYYSAIQEFIRGPGPART